MTNDENTVGNGQFQSVIRDPGTSGLTGCETTDGLTGGIEVRVQGVTIWTAPVGAGA